MGEVITHLVAMGIGMAIGALFGTVRSTNPQIKKEVTPDAPKARVISRSDEEIAREEEEAEKKTRGVMGTL